MITNMAKLLSVVEKIVKYVEFEPYGLDEEWEARIDPVDMDNLREEFEKATK